MCLITFSRLITFNGLVNMNRRLLENCHLIAALLLLPPGLSSCLAEAQFLWNEPTYCVS